MALDLPAAVRSGHAEEVRALILRDAVDINAVDTRGRSALDIACALLKPDCIRVLVEGGAAVSPKMGVSPLFRVLRALMAEARKGDLPPEAEQQLPARDAVLECADSLLAAGARLYLAGSPMQRRRDEPWPRLRLRRCSPRLALYSRRLRLRLLRLRLLVIGLLGPLPVELREPADLDGRPTGQDGVAPGRVAHLLNVAAPEHGTTTSTFPASRL